MQIEFIHNNISHTRIYTTELSSYFGILGPKKCKIHCDGPSSKYKFDFYLILDIIDVIIGKAKKEILNKYNLNVIISCALYLKLKDSIFSIIDINRIELISSLRNYYNFLIDIDKFIFFYLLFKSRQIANYDNIKYYDEIWSILISQNVIDDFIKLLNKYYNYIEFTFGNIKKIEDYRELIAALIVMLPLSDPSKIITLLELFEKNKYSSIDFIFRNYRELDYLKKIKDTACFKKYYDEKIRKKIKYYENLLNNGSLHSYSDKCALIKFLLSRNSEELEMIENILEKFIPFEYKLLYYNFTQKELNQSIFNYFFRGKKTGNVRIFVSDISNCVVSDNLKEIIFNIGNEFMINYKVNVEKFEYEYLLKYCIDILEMSL